MITFLAGVRGCEFFNSEGSPAFGRLHTFSFQNLHPLHTLVSASSRMKIILSKPVQNLGLAGDVVDVAPGYGRNFLIAKGLAAEATADAVQKIKATRQKHARKREAQGKARNAIREALSGQTILIKAQANEEGHLFGGIGPKEITESIEKRKKIHIDPKAINLPRHLKALGKHEVVLDLGGGDSIAIIVEVARHE